MRRGARYRLAALLLLLRASLPAGSRGWAEEVAAGSPEARLRTALEARARGDLPEALHELDALEQTDPAFHAAHGLDYLAGVVFAEAGSETVAARRLRRVAEGNGALAARATVRLASLLEREEPGEALRLVQGFDRRFPQSGVEREALVLEVKLRLRAGGAGDRARGERLLEALPFGSRREVELGLFAAAREAGRQAEALARARRLLARRNDDEAAGEAALYLLGDGAPGLDPEERFDLASVLVAQRRFAPALEALDRLLESGPRPPMRDRILLLIGRTAFKHGDDLRARAALDDLAETAAARETRDWALFQRGRIALSCGEEDAAIDDFRVVAAEAPTGSTVLGDALLKLLRLAARRGELDEVSGLLEELQRRCGRTATATTEGAIEAASAALDHRDPATALARLAAVESSDPATAREIVYWRGKALVASGQDQAAGAAFLAVAMRGDDLFGALARQCFAALPPEARPDPAPLLAEARAALQRGDAEAARRLASLALQDGGAVGAAARDARDLLRVAYRTLPLYRDAFGLELERPLAAQEQTPIRPGPSSAEGRARGGHTAGGRASGGRSAEGRSGRDGSAPLAAFEALRFLGLDAEAADSLRASGEPARDLRAAYVAADLARRGGDPKAALLQAERIVRRLPPGFRRELLPRALSELLYPDPFDELVERAALGYRVDPDLVRAIMREESLFDSRALSAAGARGLMQLIPETAERLGRATGIDATDPRAAYAPEVAIPLGTAYLAELLALFGGREGPAVAAYNAGEDMALQWLGRTRRGELDEFLREIEFTETRAYVDRVLTTLAAYRRRHGDELLE